jgi:hypothetical protein
MVWALLQDLFVPGPGLGEISVAMRRLCLREQDLDVGELYFLRIENCMACSAHLLISICGIGILASGRFALAAGWSLVSGESLISS